MKTAIMMFLLVPLLAFAEPVRFGGILPSAMIETNGITVEGDGLALPVATQALSVAQAALPRAWATTGTVTRAQMADMLNGSSGKTWTIIEGDQLYIYQITNSTSVYVVSTSSTNAIYYTGPDTGEVFVLDSQWNWTLSGWGTITAGSDHTELGPFVATSIDPFVGTEYGLPSILVGSGPDALGSFVIDWVPITNRYEVAKQEATVMMISEHNADPDAHAAQFGLGTNWVVRAGLSGSVSFVNDSERPQAWSGTGALTISSVTALRPPEPVYWTLQGFSSVTFPADCYFVGGGTWQTNMVNHFVIWVSGGKKLVNFITATEV